MAESSREFVLYLAARRAEAALRPELTAAQLAAYTALLETAERSPEKLEEEAGDMAGMARAELVDLHRGLAHVCALFPFPFQSEAHERAAQLMERSQTHADLAGLQSRVTELSADGQRRSSEIQRHLVDLFTSLTGWRAARPSEKSGRALLAKSAWQELLAADPEFSWKKIRTFLPYRALTPYSDEHLSLLEAWFQEISR